MTYAKWGHHPKSDIWIHPETGIRIADEDMPWELKPEEK